ncbi:kinase-like protein [Xylariaceae sp. FL0255]|nr:kinase-like protein [Xylariaceae sp. FL0255]
MASLDQDRVGASCTNINRINSERNASLGAPYNLAPNVVITKHYDNHGDDNDGNENQRKRPGTLQSYASTLNDRGDSERLRGQSQDATGFKPDSPSGPLEEIVHKAGDWSELSDATNMARRLRGSFVESADGRKFLPLDALRAIVTKEAVHVQLTQAVPRISTSVLEICGSIEFEDQNRRLQYTSRQKIFATLVLIDQNSIAAFENQQWITMAPYFAKAEDMGEKVHFYPLSPHDILPFVKPGTDDRGNPAYLNKGFFSTVRRVKIHKAHHNFPVAQGNDKGADFAVKTITRVYDNNEDNADHKKWFDREVEALKKFCQRDERHIIKLLATFEIGGVYHLLFPVADGDLMDFWEHQKAENPEVPGSFSMATLWLAHECLGIAQALQKIHNFTYSPSPDGYLRNLSQMRVNGIHGDIKAQNVLWFKKLPSHLTVSGDRLNGMNNYRVDLGHLQLSDFGTVYFHRDSSKQNTQILVKNTTYRAPECDLPRDKGSAAIDIWAFGCLYLDLITWLLRGFNSVDEEFPATRTQDEPEPREGGPPKEDKFFISKKSWLRTAHHMVKPSVTEWIEFLHRQPQCSDFLHDFLDYIETNMLVVSIEDRDQCSGVVGKLQKLCRKCNNDSRYFTEGKPRTWTSIASKYRTVRRKVTHVTRFIDSHGQLVALLFIFLIIVAYFLIRHFGPGKDL